MLTVITLGLGTSCDKFLNPEQIDIVYNDVFWSTQTDAEVGLNGLYALYRGLMVSSENWYQRADVTTGFWKRGWNGGSASQLYTEGTYGGTDLDSRMWGSLSDYCDWSDFYKVVSQANMVITMVEQIPVENFKSPAAKDKVLGEAYFLRGLVYFNILRIWGNAPYLSKMIESSSQVITPELVPVLIGRTDDIVIGQNILADVNKAVEKLDYTAPGATGWGIRADKGAALALCGHVNMWMHFLAKRDRMDNVQDYLDAAIVALEEYELNSGRTWVDYSVAENVKAMFKGCSNEAVFELAVDPNSNESFRTDNTGVQAYTCKIEPHDGLQKHDRSRVINFIPRAQKANIFPEYNFDTQSGDIRPHLFFAAWDSEYDSAVNDTGGPNDDSKVTWCTKWAHFSMDAYAEWDDYDAYYANCNIPVFRHTDVMLLLAEAYCKDKQYGKALPIVNYVRQRAQIGDYTGENSGLIDEVCQQRFGELIAEGHSYYDMVRNNYFPNGHLMRPEKYKQEGYYWPVNDVILKGNTMIDQTPYWNGKTRW